MKTQGKPGIIREFSIVLIQVREKSKKTNCLVHISFSLTLSMVACKMAVPFVVNKCDLHHFA